MPAIELPTDLADRYELLADELDGFDAADELVRYVLDATADEIERRETDGDDADAADDEVVEDRLKRLGYLEK